MTLADLADLATRKNGTGYDLQCPECGQWRRRLLTTSGGLMCERCWRRVKVERRGVTVEAQRGR